MQGDRFSENQFVVYPPHGVGKILKLEQQSITDVIVEMYVIEFVADSMTLRLPVEKAHKSGLRLVSDPGIMNSACDALKKKSKIRKIIWSRRAQEYEEKINSGDPIAIAEVIRDLHPKWCSDEQSFSEKQMYKVAFERLARELAIVEDMEAQDAVNKIYDILQAA